MVITQHFKGSQISTKKGKLNSSFDSSEFPSFLSTFCSDLQTHETVWFYDFARYLRRHFLRHPAQSTPARFPSTASHKLEFTSVPHDREATYRGESVCILLWSRRRQADDDAADNDEPQHIIRPTICEIKTALFHLVLYENVRRVELPACVLALWVLSSTNIIHSSQIFVYPNSKSGNLVPPKTLSSRKTPQNRSASDKQQ